MQNKKHRQRRVMSGTFYLFFIQFLNHNLAERINSYEKKKNIYPLFGSSDDDRYHDGLFIGSAKKRKFGRSDSENHDDDYRKTRAPGEENHHHNDRK
jgi:hypothetical protein